MTYYRTLAEDVQRAREIIDRGKAEIPESIAEQMPDVQREAMRARLGGAVIGADTFAAWHLLRTFVEVCEAIDIGVIKTAMRAHARSAQCECRTCGHSAGAHVAGSCLICGGENCWK